MEQSKMENVLITGGSSGIGRAIVEALLARSVPVTVLARNAERLEAVRALGAAVVQGDATDRATMDRAIAEGRPTTLILNAGATPVMAALDEQTWDSFDRVWSSDVKATLHGFQAAFAAPMPRGSRVIAMSSGAAMMGAPLSGSYAGAKRMIWFMARDANAIAEARDASIRFQTLVPMQLVTDTPLGLSVAREYARRRGVSVETHVAERYGASVTARSLGERIAEWLTGPAASGVAFGVRESGVSPMDEPPMSQRSGA
jgi:NAD(P)-dependent dehydrogenase (short-subunit alcohol dehydrogenase family)